MKSFKKLVTQTKEQWVKELWMYKMEKRERVNNAMKLFPNDPNRRGEYIKHGK